MQQNPHLEALALHSAQRNAANVQLVRSNQGGNVCSKGCMQCMRGVLLALTLLHNNTRYPLPCSRYQQ